VAGLGAGATPVVVTALTAPVSRTGGSCRSVVACHVDDRVAGPGTGASPVLSTLHRQFKTNRMLGP